MEMSEPPGFNIPDRVAVCESLSAENTVIKILALMSLWTIITVLLIISI
jgi:hypothetical protein